MPNFAIALEHYKSGRLREAEGICRQIISQQPDSLDVLHLGGAIAHQLRKYSQALAYYQQIIALNPNLASVHNNLGVVLKDFGKTEVIACWCRILQAVSL